MEMEARPAVPEVANKVWKIVRVLLFMLKKGIAKSKIMVELHLLVKRGKLAGKAFANSLMLLHHHHYAAFTCRSHDSHLSFISPRDYEFSCNNSPAFPAFHAIINRKRKPHHFPRFFKPYHQYDNFSTVHAAQKVLLDMLNHEKLDPNYSPSVTLPGFGKSPIGRQLRITDSPFPLKDDEGDQDHAQVDKAAEEFINKFYKDLNLQKTMAALNTPYHDYSWGR